MNKLTPVTTISHKDNSSGASLTANYKIPAIRYGEQASLIALLKDCIASLISQPPKFTSVLLVLALTIPAAIAIVSTGLQSAEKNLLASRHITVFLTGTSLNEAARLADTIAANTHINAAVAKPLDLQNKEVITISVHPADSLGKAQLAFIVDELNSHSSVDYVAADEAWLDRNIDAIETAKALRRWSIIVAALITTTLVYLLTRSDLPRQQSEASALGQMGASRKTVLKPVILRCTLLTFFAATIGTLLACGLVTGLFYLVDITTYGQILPDSFPAIRLISLIALAVLSSILTVRFYVKKH